MAGTFRCVVGIHTRELLDEDVYYANVPGIDGMYGVLPGHELNVSLNKRGGICTVHLDETGNDKVQFLIYDGASQMFNGILTVLGEFAVDVTKIDEEAVRADLEEATKRIEVLESAEELSAQDKTRLRVYKHRQRWDNYQLDYLKGSTQK